MRFPRQENMRRWECASMRRRCGQCEDTVQEDCVSGAQAPCDAGVGDRELLSGQVLQSLKQTIIDRLGTQLREPSIWSGGHGESNVN